jgi:predicted O-methyltransferase YrrM
MPMFSASFRQALPRPVREARSRLSALASYDRGRLHVPPPAAKRRHLLDVVQERGHDTLVEAGTYRGDTSAYFAPHARKVVTIEVDPGLAAKARERFAQTPKDEPAVDIIRSLQL